MRTHVTTPNFVSAVPEADARSHTTLSEHTRYDNGGRLTYVSRQIGSGTTTEINTTITYDSDNRVVTMMDGVYAFAGIGYSNTPLATMVYGYDSASRVTTEVTTDPSGTDTYTYTYDNANELTGVDKNGTQVESYAFDANGNRTGTGYSTTVMNEAATSPGPVTYTYDNSGNMITSKSGSTTTTYTYDYRNRLTEVTTRGTIAATYTYNALDQRIGVDDSSTQTWTVYNGTSPDANPYDDFNSSGLTVRYLFGASVVNGAVVDGVLARTSSGGTTAWYLTDKLGSVREIVGTSGSVLDQIVYDSFGNIVTETSTSSGDRFKFVGMQYDEATSQYYDHARWYNSGTGRFLGLDPASFRAPRQIFSGTSPTRRRMQLIRADCFSYRRPESGHFNYLTISTSRAAQQMIQSVGPPAKALIGTAAPGILWNGDHRYRRCGEDRAIRNPYYRRIMPCDRGPRRTVQWIRVSHGYDRCGHVGRTGPASPSQAVHGAGAGANACNERRGSGVGAEDLGRLLQRVGSLHEGNGRVYDQPRQRTTPERS